MFKIDEIYVDDKNLPKLMRALSEKGLIYNMTIPRYVNAEVKGNGKLESKGGTLTELVLHHITRKRLTQITTEDMRAVAGEGGKAPTSIFNAVDDLVEAKRLKRVGRGVYKVLTPA